SPFLSLVLFGPPGFDRDVVGHIARSSRFGGVFFDGLSLLVAVNRTFERYLPVLGAHLDAARDAGKGLIVGQRFAYFLREFTIGYGAGRRRSLIRGRLGLAGRRLSRLKLRSVLGDCSPAECA